MKIEIYLWFVLRCWSFLGCLSRRRRRTRRRPWRWSLLGWRSTRLDSIIIITALSGLGNLCKKPESGFERAELKSRVAAFLETKPQSGFAKITIWFYSFILLKPLRGFFYRKAATRLSLKLFQNPDTGFLLRLPSPAVATPYIQHFLPKHIIFAQSSPPLSSPA